MKRFACIVITITLASCFNQEAPRTSGQHEEPISVSSDANIATGKVESKEKSAVVSENDHVLTLHGYGVPLKVSQVVDRSGHPIKTVIDPAEGCPIGQVHSWINREHGFTFYVVGDSYGGPVNYSAQSRVIAMGLSNEGKVSEDAVLLGLRLGSDENEVKKKLESFISLNHGYTLTRNTDRSPLYSFIGVQQNFAFAFVLSGRDTALFIMDNKGRLIANILAGFNILQAC